MTIDLDWITKIVGVIAAPTALLTFFWSNLRREARRLAIVDLATKRLAFWKDFIETMDLATAEGSDERKAEHDRVYQAILRVQEDAKSQTQALVIRSKISRATKWSAFRFEGKKLKNWYDKLFWIYFVALSAIMLAICLLVLGYLEYQIITRHPVPDAKHIAVAMAVVFLFMIFSRLFLFQAESLKHETVRAPLIDLV